MKKFLMLAAAPLLVLSLAACDSGEQAATDAPVDAMTAMPEAAPEPVAPPIVATEPTEGSPVTQGTSAVDGAPNPADPAAAPVVDAAAPAAPAEPVAPVPVETTTPPAE